MFENVTDVLNKHLKPGGCEKKLDVVNTFIINFIVFTMNTTKYFDQVLGLYGPLRSRSADINVI